MSCRVDCVERTMNVTGDRDAVMACQLVHAVQVTISLKQDGDEGSRTAKGAA